MKEHRLVAEIMPLIVEAYGLYQQNHYFAGERYRVWRVRHTAISYRYKRSSERAVLRRLKAWKIACSLRHGIMTHPYCRESREHARQDFGSIREIEPLCHPGAPSREVALREQGGVAV